MESGYPSRQNAPFRFMPGFFLGGMLRWDFFLFYHTILYLLYYHFLIYELKKISFFNRVFVLVIPIPPFRNIRCYED